MLLHMFNTHVSNRFSFITFHFFFTFPVRPQWDIRPQQSLATRSCPWLWPEPHPTIAPSLSARPSLFVATSSLAVLVSFFHVVSISVPLWGCCLQAFAGRVLAISAVSVWFPGQHCCSSSSCRGPRWKSCLARIFGRSFSDIHCGTHWSLPCPL